MKPFQSPIEELEGDSETKSRFSSLSFQQSTEKDGLREQLPQFLEKHYVGTVDGFEEDVQRPHKLTSFVPKVFDQSRANGREKVASNDGDDQKFSDGLEGNGSVWTRWVIEDFWEKTKVHYKRGIWNDFLCDLTRDFRTLLDQPIRTESTKKMEQWFIFRFGLLQNILTVLQGKRLDTSFQWKRVEEKYNDDWIQEFEKKNNLHILNLAKNPREAMKVFERSIESFQNDSAESVDFQTYNIVSEDAFVLEFLRQLTEHISNSSEDNAKDRKSKEINYSTWYQGKLTRALSSAHKEDAGSSVHDLANIAIGDRKPLYERIEQDKDAISTFLGFVNLRVRQNTREFRRVRYLVAMMRDFDDVRSVRVESRRQAEEDLEKDKEDLQLFTGNFFRVVGRFIANALSRRQVEILSTDVTQIARNWYSSGVQEIVDTLELELKKITQRAEPGALGRMRSELIQSFFDALVKVLLREENRPDDNTRIQLESFPFDRAINVPIVLSEADWSRLSYSRTIVTSDSNSNWDKADSIDVYELIRKFGRIWDSTDGKKTDDARVHIGQSFEKLIFGSNDPNESKNNATEELVKLSPHTALAKTSTLFKSLIRLSDVRNMDAFARSLYEANSLQTLSLAGTVLHFLKGVNKSNLELWNHCAETIDAHWRIPIDSIKRTLSDALEASIGTVERAAVHKPVETRVYMDKEVVLEPLDLAYMSHLKGRTGIQRRSVTEVLRDVNCLPFFHELFHTIDNDNYLYGLAGLSNSQEGLSKSKIFYVYYSIAVPTEISDFVNMDDRYRGVFCLLLDDSTTDPKDEQGDVADKQDIRTLLHNSANSLRLILEAQSLQNRILKPGIEQYVLGMLHRLKNKLGVPSVVLGEVERVLRIEQGESSVVNDDDEPKVAIPLDHASRVVHGVQKARQTINDVEELFQNLKKVSESQHEAVTLEVFSSNWLAWLFVWSTAEAALSMIGRVSTSNEGRDSIGKIEKKIEKISKHAEGMKERERHDSVSIIESGELLSELQQQIEKALGLIKKPGPKLAFSFTSFSSENIYFRGGHQLVEALNILFENAFQAMWTNVMVAEGKEKLGLLRVVIRPDSADAAEVLIEILNSSEHISSDLEKMLNSPDPKPITFEQHAASSGKKGGSGFGHYYARQVIREFCGGRSYRKDLDVIIQNEGSISDGLAKSSVNLLAARGDRAKIIEVRDLFETALNTFSGTDVSGIENLIEDPSFEEAQVYFPGDLDGQSVLEICHKMLYADREKQQNQLITWLQTRPCGQIRQKSEDLCHWLIESLELLRAAEPKQWTDYKEFYEELRNIRKFKPGSFSDLKKTLVGFVDQLQALTQLESFPYEIFSGDKKTKKRPSDLNETAAAEKELLREFLNTKDLWHGTDLLPEDFFEKNRKQFEKFVPFLKVLRTDDGSNKNEDSKRLFYKLLDNLDYVDKTTVPRLATVAKLIKGDVFAFGCEKSDGHVNFVMKLFDGPAEPEAEESGTLVDEASIAKWFRRNGLARRFLKFSDAIRLAKPESEICEGKLTLHTFSPQHSEIEQSPFRLVKLELCLVDSEKRKSNGN